MVATPGFSPHKGTYKQSKPISGGNRLGAEFNYTEHKNMLGMTLDDGKASAFAKVKQGLKADSISKKVDGWSQTHSDDVSNHKTLLQAYKDCFAAWEGDDADTAQETFGNLVKSAEVMPGYTKQMHSATNSILAAVNEALGTASEGKQHLGPVVNPFSHSDGGADEKEWNKLCDSIQAEWTTMDQQVTWQAKTGATDPTQSNHQTPGGGAGVGGVSTPHTSSTPNHLSTTPNKIDDTKNLDNTDHKFPYDDNTAGDNDTTVPKTYDPWDDGSNADTWGTPGTGSGDFDSSGTPGLDAGSTLAGFDPGGAGGGTVGAGSGVGGLDGGLAGAGSTTGAGLGAAGAGTTAGGAAGMGTTAGGAGGAGAPGMMAPMRGGAGGSGSDDERERNTWLTEDEDVWGDNDAPPAVIS